MNTRTALMLDERGSGKTDILLTRVLLALLTDPGAEGLLCAPSWLRVQELLSRLQDLGPARRYLRTVNTSTGTLTFANGSRLHCRSCGTENDIHALRGMRNLAFAAIDEADHCDFQHLYGVVQTLIRPSEEAQRATIAPDPALPPWDIRSWPAYEFAAGMGAGVLGQTIEGRIASLIKPGGRIWMNGSYAEVGPLHLLAGLTLSGRGATFNPPKDVGVVTPSNASDTPSSFIRETQGTWPV
jgi:hypothetical protein